MDNKTSENFPQCSTTANSPEEMRIDKEIDVVSVTSKEIVSHILDVGNTSPDLVNNNNNLKLDTSKSSNPFVLLSKSMINQPLRISSNLPSLTSLNNPEAIQPLTLFLQALAKLNESSINLAIQNNLLKSAELTPPDSLTNAPPSYSFVLRQMAARRRRRLMGTFIPSPSFVQHTPPPNYATAFDIYLDTPLPQPPTRNYSFGFTPIPIVCPECGYAGFSIVTSKITICTHLCAVVLCLLCCWICAPLPYVLKSCKDVYHYCRNCRYYLGMYCPTNTESSYS